MQKSNQLQIDSIAVKCKSCNEKYFHVREYEGIFYLLCSDCGKVKKQFKEVV